MREAVVFIDLTDTNVHRDEEQLLLLRHGGNHVVCVYTKMSVRRR